MTPKLRTFAIWGGLSLLACVAILGEQGGVFSEHQPLVLIFVVALAAVLGLVWYGKRAQNNALGGIQALRSHKARLLQPGAETTRFTDVGGLAAAKASLGDVVDWLQHPERWEKAHVRPPRGVLLEGPPGTGKTLLARAVAGEAGVKFFVANATEFVEMFVGVGPARVRDLFEAAGKEAPCVIFIDELDAIGRRRGSGVGHTNEEREQALNELLIQMDGFERQRRVVVMAASNRADVLDSALLRPGRFDIRLRVGDLSATERAEVLAVHARGRELAAGVDLAAIAMALDGATGAVLESLLNDSAMAAMRRARTGGSAQISRADLEDALDRAQSVESVFTVLDQLLVESASQLAEPVTACHVRVRLASGEPLEGRLLWANAELLKLQPLEGGARLLNRREVRELVAIAPAGLTPS